MCSSSWSWVLVVNFLSHYFFFKVISYLTISQKIVRMRNRLMALILICQKIPWKEIDYKKSIFTCIPAVDAGDSILLFNTAQIVILIWKSSSLISSQWNPFFMAKRFSSLLFNPISWMRNLEEKINPLDHVVWCVIPITSSLRPIGIHEF